MEDFSGSFLFPLSISFVDLLLMTSVSTDLSSLHLYIKLINCNLPKYVLYIFVGVGPRNHLSLKYGFIFNLEENNYIHRHHHNGIFLILYILFLCVMYMLHARHRVFPICSTPGKLKTDMNGRYKTHLYVQQCRIK